MVVNARTVTLSYYDEVSINALKFFLDLINVQKSQRKSVQQPTIVPEEVQQKLHRAHL